MIAALLFLVGFSPVIELGSKAVSLNGQQIVRLTHGFVPEHALVRDGDRALLSIEPLSRALKPLQTDLRETEVVTVNIVDVTVPIATLFDVLRTLERAGIRHFRATFAGKSVFFTLPLPARYPSNDKKFSLDVESDGFLVSPGVGCGEVEHLPKTVDLLAVSRTIRDSCGLIGGVLVRTSADYEVTTAEVLDAMITVQRIDEAVASAGVTLIELWH